MMKLMFILAAVSIPLFIYFDKGATGLLLSLFFMFLAAFFSKRRFNKKDQ
ncbi:hypothetical protein [Aquibacillus rhizosphaerae]|uniref:Uncharacterized protein n=1 Tax=Aquibacillus rhizosphaerae TaxID=3051431 RepID=A0ABT7L0U7_9BACI|nr:hypothetical protein [Aquibacillus sp. LR5S19]MDL4839472.1 hypothetical protein [Aquibacillus sp. LR5S19]